MASVTSWWRLEARARDPGLGDGLEMAIADPAWLLGRQWQTGEWQGRDGGTPVNARAHLDVRAFGWYRPGAGSSAASSPLDLARTPLRAARGGRVGRGAGRATRARRRPSVPEADRR